jgi:hypothetical protein
MLDLLSTTVEAEWLGRGAGLEEFGEEKVEGLDSDEHGMGLWPSECPST